MTITQKIRYYDSLQLMCEILIETRKQIMELFKDKKAGAITNEGYNQKYDELPKVVRKLEEEKNLAANNTNDYIRKEQLTEINQLSIIMVEVKFNLCYNNVN